VPFDRLSDNAAVIEDDELRIDCDVAAIAGLAFDRGPMGYLEIL
jgi:hypothetical protein